MQVNVIVTEGRRRKPDEWAHMAVQKILSISEDTPEPLRSQASKFQADVYKVITNYIDMAVTEKCTLDMDLALNAGQPELVELIKQT